jgi:uncharacterized protein YecT (DUF1311 family)
MKKIFIITLIACSTIFMAGCGQSNKEGTNNITETKQEDNSTDTQNKSNNQDNTIKPSNSENNNSSQKSNDTSDNKTSNADGNKVNKKDYYTKKLNDIQSKTDKEYNDKDQLTTYDMRTANSAKYKLWDAALNEIYNDLKNNLSANDMEKLKQEELKWISKKESDAKNASKKFEGGTAEPVFYGYSVIESTKKRCYELVDKYMS